MQLTVVEMKNGVSETDALFRFGTRCILSEIKKFTSTIVQGIIKGNSELTYMLQEQSKEVWAAKKQNVKRQGEKAGKQADAADHDDVHWYIDNDSDSDFYESGRVIIIYIKKLWKEVRKMFRLADKALFKARLMVHRFFHQENGEVNIVATVVLIGIAVLLAVLFKEQIANLLNNLFKEIDTSATDAIKGGK